MKKILLILIILPALIFAQEYTLEQLIETGLDKSYDIQSELANNKNSASYLRSSLYGILPSVSISAQKDKYLDAIDPEWNASASLSISKSIFLNEPTYYNIHTSILDKKNADLSLEEKRKQIAYYIFSSYLNVLESQKILGIQKKNLELQEKIYNQVKVQYDAGEKSLLELKQSEISLIDYEIAVNEAENSLFKTRKDLFSYLNMKDEGYDFVEPEFDISDEKFSFQSNNTLLQKKNSLTSSKVRLVQTMMDFLPSLTLSYSVNHNDDNDIYAYSDYLRASNTLSIYASYDIFNLLEKGEAYSRSKRNLRVQKIDFETSKRDYTIELTNLQNDLKTLNRSYTLYSDKLKLSEDNLNMAQEQYRLGMISLLDMDRAKIDHQNAQLSYNNHHYNLLRKQEEINLLLSNKILGKW
ncbi:MAG: TolC family protein [Candidatus Cloacimonetes bacterium]|nr:TolC family protein [Candidatus Cloacimonadota bacterium]MBL7148992.1 TolC family protein [Candidatus Cloacimonadota bacterium]